MGKYIIAVLVVILAVLVFTFTRRGSAEAAKMEETMDAIFQRNARAFGVDWRLVKAIAIVESSLNPAAVNAADRESVGLMQVLCQPDGKGGCRNRFPAVVGWSGATREKLLQPDFNVYIGAQIIATNLRDYGSIPKAVAVYNAWDQRNAPRAGPFKNQRYVDKVIGEFVDMGGDAWPV